MAFDLQVIIIRNGRKNPLQKSKVLQNGHVIPLPLASFVAIRRSCYGNIPTPPPLPLSPSLRSFELRGGDKPVCNRDGNLTEPEIVGSRWFIC